MAPAAFAFVSLCVERCVVGGRGAVLEERRWEGEGGRELGESLLISNHFLLGRLPVDGLGPPR